MVGVMATVTVVTSGRDVRARYLTSLVRRGVAAFDIRRSYLVVVVVVLVRARRRGTCVSGRAP